MSGGKYNYAYERIADVAADISLEGGCHAAPPSVRRAFKAHLCAVAAALKAIEWNDSGDGDKEEENLLRELLSPLAPLDTARELAEAAMKALKAEIERSMT